MKVNSKMINFLEMENILQHQDKNIKDNGKIIKKKDLEFRKLITKNMMDNGKIIKNKVKGNIFGLMEISGKELGKMMFF